MIRMRTAAAVGAAAIMSVGVLAGCSSDSGDSADSGDSTQMLPPVIIAEGDTSASCGVGDYLDILIPEGQLAGTTVDTSDAGVVEVTQAKEEGGAIFNPGGQCVSAGSATITVTSPDGSTRDIAMTVTE
jgi:hypothetical protein